MITCQSKYCKSAAFQCPRLHIAAVGHPDGVRAEIVIGLALCGHHSIPDSSKYITEDSWQRLVDAFRSQGRVDPDRKTIVVDFISIPDAEKILKRKFT